MVTDVVHAKGGCIILLDVPPSSTITLDGVTRVTPSLSASTAAVSTQQSPFHRGLWIINNISCDIDSHLLVVRSGNRKEDTTSITSGGDCRTLPVGFVISNDTQTHQTTTIANELGYQWILARKYDPYTEEISNTVLDEITMKNVILAMEVGKELHQFVISYDQFMSTPSNSNNNSISSTTPNLPSWDKRTSMINSTFLQQYHQLSSGNKIVPSSEGQDDTTTIKNEEVEDGKSISYPSIPCIDTTINARQLAQHSGTRIYLSKLSPHERTWLLFGNSDTNNDSKKKKSPGEFVLNDVLCRYYGKNSDGNDSSNAKKSEDNFLADIELSFIIFLFLECHASLEHWRDAISMCSLLTTTPTDDTTAAASSNVMIIQHPLFFQKLLSILYNQLSCIETEFFQDVEYSSGKDNFMIGALRRLCKACECDMGKRKRDGDASIESLKSTSQKLRLMVRERFGLDLLSSENDNNDDEEMETDALWSTTGEDYGEENKPERTSDQYEMDEGEEDDEDGPVIVDYDQIQASLARTSQTPKRQAVNQMHCKEYPLLYAAMAPQEDEVMACARILDEAKDVSLVREAAAYLEEVEAHRCKTY